MDKHLHIVCFDVPYPPDYGGVIDIFYRIKSLHKIGIKIHLHCFEYGRGEQNELTKYCGEVIYYKRKTGLKGFSFRLPYIVSSRSNKELLKNLQKNDHPVLLEGIHCSYFLFKNALAGRKVFVRLHNVEYEYYYKLAKSETSFFKRKYYSIESTLLKSYESKISDKAAILAITQKDAATYKEIVKAPDVRLLPAFIPDDEVSCKEGKGSYCLYHGNLSVTENEKIAKWLVSIFEKLPIPLIIAGKNPSDKLIEWISKNKNVTFAANPSKEKMIDLISNAQINVLPSFNSAGIKIKLLNALFTGRHCIVNNATVDGTGLASLCNVADDEKEIQTAIQKLFVEPFTINEIEKRRNLLEKEYNNNANAKQLMQWIY